MKSIDNNDKILVILPTYNESNNISKIVNVIKSLNLGLSILIVDDNSPDGTGRIADEISKNDRDIFVIHRKKKLGLGSAYVKGFKFAFKNGFDYVCEMDADFSHEPKYLVDFVKNIKTNDLVIGSRYMDGVSIVHWPFIRLVLSFFANKFTKFITGMPFADCTGGFKCFRTDLIKDMDIENMVSKGYAFQMEMLYRLYKKGYRIKEIPIIFYNRKSGKSKINKKEIITSFFFVIYLRLLLEFKPLFRKKRQQ